MEPWCGDIMGKHISSVEPCIGSKELTVRACVYIIVGGFGFGSVDFFMHIHISVCIGTRAGWPSAWLPSVVMFVLGFMHDKL